MNSNAASVFWEDWGLPRPQMLLRWREELLVKSAGNWFLCKVISVMNYMLLLSSLDLVCSVHVGSCATRFSWTCVSSGIRLDLQRSLSTPTILWICEVLSPLEERFIRGYDLCHKVNVMIEAVKGQNRADFKIRTQKWQKRECFLIQLRQ